MYNCDFTLLLITLKYNQLNVIDTIYLLIKNSNPLSLLVDQSSSKYWVGRAKLPGVIVHVFLGEILIRHAVTAMTPHKHLK